MASFLSAVFLVVLVLGFVIYNGRVSRRHSNLSQFITSREKNFTKSAQKETGRIRDLRYTILINNCYIYTIGNSQYQTSLRALTELMYGENGF